MIGSLDDLECLLKHVMLEQPDQVHLFEIISFCVNGEWLEVDVLMPEPYEYMAWGAYAGRLEEALEVEEAAAVRARFG
jgi:hypothetical protein